MNKTSEQGIDFIQGWEGCRLEAYQDVAGVWTIGYGTIRYPNGQRVGQGDACTVDEADHWFRLDLRHTEDAVDDLTIDAVAGHQFDPIVSFAYNLGTGAYRGSTLRKLINTNPNNPAIRWEWMKWHHANHKPVEGLWNRRWAETCVYCADNPPRPTFPHA